VFLKSAPTDSLQKQHERCRTLLREIDAAEEGLKKCITDLTNQHDDFYTELRRSLYEIESIESMRQQFFKDALLRYCQATFGMLEHVEQVLTSLRQYLDVLDACKDVDDFEKLYNNIHNNGTIDENNVTMKFINSLSSGNITEIVQSPSNPNTAQSVASSSVFLEESTISTSDAALRSPIAMLKKYIVLLDWLKVCLDTLKGVCLKATTSFTEVGDAQKFYGKIAMKIFEKHGYSKSAVAAASSSAASLLKAADAKCADLVSRYESPMCRLGWNSVVQSIEKFAEAHSTSSEIILEKGCTTIENLHKKIDIHKKDISDKLGVIMKRLEGAKAAEVKVSGKLAKVRKELRDRRGKVISKEDAASLPLSDASVRGESQNDHFSNEMIDSSTSGQKVDDAMDISTSGSKVDESNNVSSAMSSTARISFTALGAVSAFGAAVGVGASVERNMSRISVLEDEEKALTEQYLTARASLEVVSQESTAEMLSLINNTKNSVSKYISDIAFSFRSILDGHNVSLNITKGAIEKAFSEAQNIDITSDMENFSLQVKKLAVQPTEDNKPAVNRKVVIPPLPIFTPIIIEAIEIERTNERESLKNEKLKGDSSVSAASLLTNANGDDEHDTDASDTGVYNKGAVSDDEMLNDKDVFFNHPSDGVTHIDKHKDKVSDHQKLSITDTVDETLTPIPEEGVENNNESESKGMSTPIRVDNEKDEFKAASANKSPNSALSVSVLEEKEGRPSAFSDDIFSAIHPSDESNTVLRSISSPLPSNSSSHARALSPSLSTSGTYTTQPNKEENLVAPELAKFGMSSSEKILEYFSCALYPKRGLLTHGRYIYDYWLCFCYFDSLTIVSYVL
jgi:hypothetical protein